MGKDILIPYSHLLVWIVAEDDELVYPLVKRGNSSYLLELEGVKNC